MRLRLTLIMLRGRIEYHGLSCLAMGSNSLTLADVRGYAFALWTQCQFIDDEDPNCRCSPPE